MNLVREEDRPSCSGYKGRQVTTMDQEPERMSPKETAEMKIREAEVAKARIFLPKGKGKIEFEQPNFKFIAQMDRDYLVVGSHVDEATQEKIQKGSYIDFSKLIPKDRILTEGDNRLE